MAGVIAIDRSLHRAGETQLTAELTERRLPWDRITAMALALAVIATLAVYGLVMVAFFDRTLDYIHYPFGNDYGEGPILFQLAALTAGDPIYQPIAEAPYAVANYPPVFHYVVWPIALILGDPLVAGRLVSFLAALASGILIFTLVGGSLHREHSPLARRVGAAIAGLFFLTHYTVIGWSATMRVDTLALAIGLLGMQLFVLSLQRPKLTWVYGAVFVLAAFTKPNMAAAALATFGTAYVLRRRDAAKALAISCIAGLGALSWLAVATDGEFFRHVVVYNVNEFRIDLLVKHLRQSVFWRGTDIVVLIGGGCYLLFRVFMRRRAHPAAKRSGLTDVPSMLFGGMLAASLLNIIGSGKTGASVSYFLEFEAAASLLLGILAVRLATFLRSDPWSPACRRRRILVVAGLAVLCWQATVGWDMKFRAPDWQAVSYSQRVADLIATADGPVVSEEMVLLQRAGRPLYFQPFIMTRLAQDGRWDPTPLTRAMRNGEVSFVVLYSAIGSARYKRRFPEGFRAALESRYRLREQVGHLAVYVPR